MEVIDRTSRLAVEFTLSWSSGTMTHLDRYYADPVSSWRDVLDDGLAAGLLGRGAGACAEVAIGAGRFHTPRDERRVVRVRPAQFQGLDGAGKPLVPRIADKNEKEARFRAEMTRLRDRCLAAGWNPAEIAVAMVSLAMSEIITRVGVGAALDFLDETKAAVAEQALDR